MGVNDKGATLKLEQPPSHPTSHHITLLNFNPFKSIYVEPHGSTAPIYRLIPSTRAREARVAKLMAGAG